jgi:hypothetical protein
MYAAKQIEPLDDEIAEEWLRDIPAGVAHDAQGVDVTKQAGAGEWAWRVTVSAMEFIREDPLESMLRAEIVTALRAVAGVKRAEADDREVWVVDGTPTGQALVDAVGAVVDRHADAIRAGFD